MYKMALIGNPVKQSASPKIHQSFLNTLKLDGTYQLFEITEEKIEKTIQHFIDEQFVGFNVTIPFKEKIINYLDDLDESAVKLRAVNTVKIKSGQLIGYNTDGIGYIQSLKETYPHFFDAINEKRVLIIGAGGAAKGIYYTFQTTYSLNKIDVANRTLEHAQLICSEYENSEAFSLSEASKRLNSYDLIIQTTSVGMEPNETDKIIQLQQIKKDVIVSDIVYKPKWTSFLKEAHKLGAHLLFGDSMLYYQAREAFKIWTGMNPKINHVKLQ